MIFDLPRSVEFGGREWEINTDFRDVLLTLAAFEDPDLSNEEKAFVCLRNLYVDFESIQREQMQEAFDAALKFIDRGEEGEGGPKIMDWTQDANIIFPAVNAVAGYEVRSVEYLHWWTFVGYFMEIKDSTAATVFGLRQKRARGKKLEKWEKEYWQENKALCQPKPRLTEEEKAEQERLRKILG